MSFKKCNFLKTLAMNKISFLVRLMKSRCRKNTPLFFKPSQKAHHTKNNSIGANDICYCHHNKKSIYFHIILSKFITSIII